MYTEEAAEQRCTNDCTDFKECICSECHCCTACTLACCCPSAEQDLDAQLARLLNLHSGEYRCWKSDYCATRS